MIGKAFDILQPVNCHSRYNRLVKARRDSRWWMLKGLKPEFDADMVMHELLRKEFNLGMMLRHQGIVGVVSFEQVPQLGGGEFIVLEWVEGVTLKQWLEQPHSWREKVDVLQQLCDALDYCHRMNVVHRDIKPSNIMITPDSRAVIIDMGLAVTGNQITFRAPAGTDRYMAPEQRQEGVVINGQADLYAVGCIMREMGLPRRFNRVTQQLLQPERAKRLPDASSLRRELARAAVDGTRVLTWACGLLTLMACATAAYALGAGHWGASLLGVGAQVAPTLPDYLTMDTVNHWKADTAHYLTESTDRFSYSFPKVTTDIPGNISEDVAVDLGLSVLWAPFNVGCERANMSMTGGYYGYGDPTGRLTSTDTKSRSLYWNISSLNDYSGTEYDIATVKWGGRWRSPRKADVDELLNRCQWTFIRPEGTCPGYLVVGPNGNKIFLPLAGFRYDYDYYELGEMGYYWITVPRNEQMRASSQSGFLGLVLHLVPGAIHYGYGLVDDGFSIRPVLER